MSQDLERVARRQGGVFTVGQAARLGVSSTVVSMRLLDGAWRELLPGVLAASTTPVTTQLQAWAGVLAIGPPVRLAGRFAAACVGLERSPSFFAPEFAIPGNRMRRQLEGIVVRRVQPHLWAVERRHGLPVPPTATIVREVAATTHDRVALEIVEHALRRRVVTTDALVTQLGRGKWGAARLRVVLEAVAPGYQAMWERRLHHALLLLGVRLEPQVRVVAPDGRTAYIDMGDETIRYGVEVDGFLNHMARFAADRRRSRMLAVELDWTIAHYAAEELAADLVGAARDIAAEVKRRRATAAA